MKILPKALAISILLLSLILSSGCASNNGSDSKRNFLGLIKSSEGTFSRPSPSSFTVRTSELTDTANPSGDEVSLLWGLIRFQDY